MTTETPFTGGCLCGAIRFRAAGPALNPHTCSCKMCQRHSGALTTTWVEFPKEAVQWTGPGGPPATFRSSDYSSRAFCKSCGSTLGAIDDDPTVALMLGVFDTSEDANLIPKSHSFQDQKPNWWRCSIQSD